jgi:DUF1680 family protein
MRIVRGDKEEYPEVSKHSEICCTTDMIEIALLLGKHADHSYYDHAERYLNQVLASQLDDASWIAPPPCREDTEIFTYQNVRERYRGSFTGRTTPNDLTNFGRYDNMGCCTAAGGRALFLLWDAAAEYSDRQLTVNLWIDVDNDKIKIVHDYENGIVFFTVQKECDALRIRVPSWLLGRKETAGVSIFDGSNYIERKPAFEKDYFVFNHISAGTTIKISYPVSETKDVQVFCGEEYKVYWNGNRVVEVLPRGEYMPLYVRGR